MNEIQQQIEQLRTTIEAHNHAYYVENRPTISDYDFDMLLKQLEALEREHPEYDDPLSPTHRVGSDLTSGFEQVAHVYPMLSLGNTYSPDEVDQWVGRMEAAVGRSELSLVGEMKFDGTGISLIYEHGRLERAVTRGDGTQGDVVTANVKTIRSIPLKLQGSGWPDFFEIRGEIVLPFENFDRINAERALNEEPLFANPRNAAAGTLKLSSPTEVGHRGLDAYFYYLLGENLPFDSHYENMEAARSWGFKVSTAMTRLHSMAEVDDFITRWDTERRSLPVATDGLVFKVDSLTRQQQLGFTSKTPRWAVAYKFAAERALTQLRFVSFDVGRLGVITPVANLEPVLLSGTIVKRASMHNADIMHGLDIHNGDWVYVEKGGEIIPKITGVELSRRDPAAEEVTFVSYCPACGAPLVRVEGEAAWTCPNKYHCPPQIIGRIEHFVARKMMNIDGIGEETVAALYNSGKVHSYADLYDLTVDDFLCLDKFAQKSAESAVKAIADSRNVPFERVLFALSIPNVGETGAKRIARAVGSIDELMSWNADRLCSIEDVGPIIAQSIIEFFAEPDNRYAVERLRAAGVQLEVDKQSTPTSDVLGGKSFVISGVFALHSRDEYKALIEQYGGRNVGSISKKTDYILAGDNMGPAKLEKATKLGVPIIDEHQFLAMIGSE